MLSRFLSANNNKSAHKEGPTWDRGWLTQGRPKGSFLHYQPFTFGLLGKLSFCNGCRNQDVLPSKQGQLSPRPVSAMATISSLSNTPSLSPLFPCTDALRAGCQMDTGSHTLSQKSCLYSYLPLNGGTQTIRDSRHSAG